MTKPRLRDVALVAVAAVMTSGLSAFAATAPDSQPTSSPADATESVSEAVVSEPSEHVTEEPSEAVELPDEGNGAATDKREKPVREPKRPKPVRAAEGGEGDADGDNARGDAASAAARGETPPVGDCRNHGHWVATVAKGLASCDDNPRPGGGKPDGVGDETARTEGQGPPAHAGPPAGAGAPSHAGPPAHAGPPPGRGKP